MRLIGYLVDGARHIGAVDGDKVTPLGTTADFYRNPQAALHAARTGDVLALADLQQAPPVPETSRIFCVGINYISHADESKSVAGLDLPKFPMIFGRWGSTLVVDGARVPVPPTEKGLDWEVELAAVIGETVWAAEEDSALQHVLGYTAFNDLSARRKQIETPQFTLGKNADCSGPIGPSIVTTDELPDPSGLRVQTRVNGELVQDGNTADLIHSVGKIIAYITDTVTLQPGDVIATGTPGGVGVGMNPQRFLTPGDVVEVEVEKIGVLRNPIISRDQFGI
ncbi:fumarylacetoacetate hydrolase family protein [Nocardia nova]|uniref:fumarylacetoacetate hydrolase family protein n=1 Tax=Nocardia nova TaxID=37330 RepID=UPI0018933832|nr:fumarylacetoacetate hydrolase family protein [Nocardia nova]MBF6148390.1 fumarylacetoacetate hydrolase family protein [Nocardia nova]MDN2496289.1 fumarylacetoacetate hydrolase family protein [Nocardia nova]